jgi:hypothetical protein
MSKDQFKKPEDFTNFALAQIGTRKLDLSATPVNISLVMEELAPKGENTKLTDVVDHTITIYSVEPFVSKKFERPAAFVIFTTEEGELRNAIIGGQVILPKLLVCAAENRLPVSGLLTYTDMGNDTGYYNLE